jgi:hypothetical protein
MKHCNERKNMNYHQRTEYKDAMSEFLPNLRPDYFITLASNQDDFPSRRGEEVVKHLDAKLNRRWLGREWASRPAADRALLFAFPEIGHGHTSTLSFPLHDGEHNHPGLRGFHYHVLLRVPPQPLVMLTRDQLADFINDAWRKFVPSGSTRTSFVSSEEQRKRTAGYCMKEFVQNGVGIENWLVFPRAGAGR